MAHRSTTNNADLATTIFGGHTAPPSARSWEILGAVEPPKRAPSIGPSVVVAMPDAAKRWLAARQDAKQTAAQAIDAKWRPRQREPEAWSRRGAEHRASTARFEVDVDAIENRAALAAAQAVEQEWQGTMERLRALYPEGESNAY